MLSQDYTLGQSAELEVACFDYNLQDSLEQT